VVDLQVGRELFVSFLRLVFDKDGEVERVLERERRVV